MAPNERKHQPETAYAIRLEAVRAQRGESLRKMWQTLQASGWSGEYRTVMRYHRDRDPPVSYLAAVAKVYRVSVEWLVAGTGGMYETASAKQKEGEFLFVLRGLRPDFFERATPTLISHVEDTIAAVVVHALGRGVARSLAPADLAAIGAVVIDLAELPLRALTGRSGSDLPDVQGFYPLALTAIQAAAWHIDTDEVMDADALFQRLQNVTRQGGDDA